MSWRVGVDSGGTFTDICLFDEASGALKIWKVASTPADPSEGIAQGTQQALASAGAAFEAVSFLGHGTTVATNTLIEMRGVKTGLMTTEGFRDLLEIGRQKRPSLYDMNADKPVPLVARDLRLEVSERLRHDGSIQTPLCEEAVRQTLQRLRAEDVKAVAICLLYGFLNPEHEKRVLALAAEILPEAFTSVSHQVAPEFREYERMSTTVVNAYLGPTMQRYIDKLAARLRDLGLRVAPQLTQSNGGVIGFETAASLPVRTVLSGPSTGVVAAQTIAGLAGFGNVITFDVGGTSSDVALLADGQCGLTGEAVVHGYPIKAPMLDIHTVGAGGGSIAEVDSGGLLKVGPRSAGAEPGPVCYGRGNTEPTVTDANIVLQTLNPVEILGGRMPVQRDLAVAAVQRLADRLAMPLMETAQGIVSVVTANMARAIRVISVQRGHDPRDYALMAFGGAGPLHAARLAQLLDMKQIIVPLTPGILCALGLLLTDLRTDFAMSRVTPLDEAATARLETDFAQLEGQAHVWFEQEQIAPEARRLTRSADLRYLGQNYELTIPVPIERLTADSLVPLRAEFERVHQQRFGFMAEDETIELVTLRVQATGLVNKAQLVPSAASQTKVEAAMVTHRPVYMPEAGGWVETPVYARAHLQAGHVLTGPAIVEQMDATTVVLPGMTARVDSYLNLILECA